MNIVGGMITGQQVEKSKDQIFRLGYDPETRELNLYDSHGGSLGTVNVGVSAFDREQIRQIVREEIAALKGQLSPIENTEEYDDLRDEFNCRVQR